MRKTFNTTQGIFKRFHPSLFFLSREHIRIISIEGGIKVTSRDITLSTLLDTVKKIVDKTEVPVKLEGVACVYHVPEFAMSNRNYRSESFNDVK